MRDIRKKAEGLVESIRELSRYQAETWRLVPWLALEADGRTGHSDNKSRAYRDGHWAILQDGGWYVVYIDLDNGELVAASAPDQPARDEDVLRLAFRLELIDADSLVSNLREQAAGPTGSYYDPEEKAAWRDKTRHSLNLQPVYRRRHVITGEEMSRRWARNLAEDMAG